MFRVREYRSPQGVRGYGSFEALAMTHLCAPSCILKIHSLRRHCNDVEPEMNFHKLQSYRPRELNLGQYLRSGPRYMRCWITGAFRITNRYTETVIQASTSGGLVV